MKLRRKKNKSIISQATQQNTESKQNKPRARLLLKEKSSRNLNIQRKPPVGYATSLACGFES